MVPSETLPKPLRDKRPTICLLYWWLNKAKMDQLMEKPDQLGLILDEVIEKLGNGWAERYDRNRVCH